jgi:hypothetical protein
MWPVSQRYLDTWARSHTQFVCLDILQRGAAVTSLTSGVIPDINSTNVLQLLGGSVSVSNTAMRRSGSIQFIDTSGTFAPQSADDLLSPFRTEMRLYVGVQYWDVDGNEQMGGAPWVTGGPSPVPSIEMVPVATLVVVNPQVNDHVITIQGYDRTWLLDNFESSYTIPTNTAVTDALINLLSLKIPSNRLVTNFPDTDATIGTAMTFDADSAITDALQRVGDLAGWTVYSDPMGTFTAGAPRQTSDDTDLTLTAGQFSTILRPTRDIGSNDVRNAVVYTNEGSASTLVRGYAEDTNPDSLTCVDAIGRRPTFYSDPSIATQAQADMAARSKLISLLGLSDSYTVPMMPFHALEVDDVLSLTDADQNITSKSVLVDGFTLPLRAADGVSAVACRANVIVS